MFKYITRRLLQGVVVLFIIIFGVFVLIRSIPTGPFDKIGGGRSRDAASLEVLNRRYGLDKPLLLNLPSDGITPDASAETRTLYEKLPDCDKLRQGVTGQEAIVGTGVEVEQGWSLVRWATEHRAVYINVNNRRVRCDQTQQVLYSDLTRSQFFQYINNVLRGDFGVAIGQGKRGQEVSEIVGRELPPSAIIGILSTIFGFLLGIPIGVVSALRRNTAVDYSLSFGSMLFASIPSFVFGPVLIYIFVLGLKWLPSNTPEVWLEPNFLDREFVLRLILPLFVMVTGIAAGVGRLTRGSVLQVLQDDYIRTARSKGVRERGVIYTHALKNALIPVVTILGPFLASVLTGTLFIERIYDIPGLGGEFVTAIGERDYTLLSGITILYSTFLIIGNITVDIMYTWLDPRIRFD